MTMRGDITILAHQGISPVIHPTAFIAPGARIIGNVHIGPEASIWYNVVIRGDVGAIRIGARTNIQDGTVIHVTGGAYDTTIGDEVLIGHQAMIHGCTLEDHSFVGFAAAVMDGCVIEPRGMLAAGAMLTPGKRIPSGQLWSGRPARFMRDLSAGDLANNQGGIDSYVEMARTHRKAIDAG